tara:strand:+ start:681 stop:821 length:141 start_codon:yes stop_codon:yes gene_type:complete
MLLAIASSDLGVSGFTINAILFASIAIILGLPVIFLSRQAKGKKAF